MKRICNYPAFFVLCFANLKLIDCILQLLVTSHAGFVLGCGFITLVMPIYEPVVGEINGEADWELVRHAAFR